MKDLRGDANGPIQRDWETIRQWERFLGFVGNKIEIRDALTASRDPRSILPRSLVTRLESNQLGVAIDPHFF